MYSRDISRREFLKMGAAAVALGTVMPSVLAQEKEFKPQLEYRVLGRTGLKPTVVAMGCMQAPEEVIAKALDLGINWFDTAHGYKGGRNEWEVGRVLKGKRNQVHICTKLPRGTAPEMTARLNQSLERLQTDYVDLLLAHNCSSRDHVFNEEIMKALENAKKNGKARFLGVSTHSNMDKVIEAAIEAKIYDAVLTTYNFQVPQAVKDAADKAQAAGLGVIAMKTQMGRKLPQTLPFPFANMTAHQAALRWVLDQPAVTCAIPGMNSFEELEEDIAVMGRKLTWLEHRRLERFAPGVAARYCVGCGRCAGTCPHGVSIPDVRRCSMYLYGYDNPELARETYRELEKNAAPCANCATCVAHCVNGVALKPILADAHARLA